MSECQCDPAISAADRALLDFVASRVMAAAGSEWEEQFICDLAASPRPLTPGQRAVIAELMEREERRAGERGSGK